MSSIIVKGKTFTDGELTLSLKFDIDKVIKSEEGYLVIYDYVQCNFNVDAFDDRGVYQWNVNDILNLDYDEVFTDVIKDDETSNCYCFYA